MPPSTPPDRPARGGADFDPLSGLSATAAAKAALRREVYGRRRQRYRADPRAGEAAGGAVRDRLLATPEISALRPGSRVAAYSELPTEVPASAVRRALAARGLTVLLPVLLPDNDLDWALAEAPAGARRLGPGAVTGVSVILLPGVAGDRDGNRLGRGGGSYDRALARLDAVRGADRPWTCLLLFSDELVDRVPVDRRDMPVDAVATPTELVRCPVAAWSPEPAGSPPDPTTIGTRTR